MLCFLTKSYNNLLLALVTGFVNLPSYMIPDCSEVLFELINFAREVTFILQQIPCNMSTSWRFHCMKKIISKLVNARQLCVIVNTQQVFVILNNSLDKISSRNKVTFQQKEDFLAAISKYVY